MIAVDASVAAGEFEATLARFRAAGFALRMVMPADDPAIALLESEEMSIRLVSGDAVWPGGDRGVPPLVPTFEVSRLAETGWGVGRAGMLYRDLLPSRQGGRFIASHIRIPDAGPVPDEVHFHDIRFQLIFCVAGWVRLVYEGQDGDFVLNAGDCVSQPPTIRHRVLEASGALEVVEITCPAVHKTWFDPELALPTPPQEREFDGQRFVLHRAVEAEWFPWRAPGFACRDTGIEAATGGVAEARVVRATSATDSSSMAHDGELQFWFVLAGEVGLLLADQTTAHLRGGDAVAVPAGMTHRVVVGDSGCEFLEVIVPGAPVHGSGIGAQRR